MATFTLLMAFAQNVWELLALTVMYGIFSGMMGAAIALVGTQVPEERLGYALGWVSTAQLSGTLSGPLLGGLLADALHDYRLVFVATSIGGFAASILALFFVREVRGPVSKLVSRGENSLGGIFQVVVLGPMFLVLVLANVCAGAVAPVVAPYVRGLLGPGATFVATTAGGAIAATGLAGLLSAPLVGRRADRLGYRKLLLACVLGAAVFTLPQALSHSIWTFLALRFGVGLFLGGILPTANAWIGRQFPREQRGRIFGITASAMSLGNFLGPLSGGLIAARFGIPVVFVVVAALMLANFLWIAFTTHEAPAVEALPSLSA
jgi:DHA1 family multidrug resistance protein-like MFS transporter